MLTRPKTVEERLAALAKAARPDFNPWHGNPEHQPLPSKAFYAFRDSTPPIAILALTSVVAAARRLTHAYGERSEMPDRVLVWRKDHDALDSALAELDGLNED